ncbi:cysteine--tRNA ligase [Candidatus Uhrbacteria bacterium]|nr:cysteine--tRNA ligase [Candidatus Uhrbacteria bacterium]
MKLTNSLHQQLEEFIPLHAGKVGMYCCGPTVYDYATIGNFRTYVIADLALRTFQFQGLDVTYIMNLTDVGHLTGDNFGDSSTGEDRLEKAAVKEQKSAWDIAKFYTDAYIADYRALHLTEPKAWVKATDHISEQISLIQELEKRGFTYATADGIYFDTEKDSDYGELSTLDQVKAGSRVEMIEGKKNPRDFALWKFSPRDKQRDMEWISPWGKGFPGWHIECSAMAMKYLGPQFDVHFGGEDLRSTHHPNEIAQSESATGVKPFVKYWLHVAFLQVDGGKMGKSLGNAYTIQDIVARGIDPLALKLFYFGAHYRSKLNFTWEALQASANALEKLRGYSERLKTIQPHKPTKSAFIESFSQAMEDDLNSPQALAIMWQMLKSDISDEEKAYSLACFDSFLGLQLFTHTIDEEIPASIIELSNQRQQAKERKDYISADILRKQIEEAGFHVVDTIHGPEIQRS